MLRTSPEQNSENLSPSSESEGCESFLHFDVLNLFFFLGSFYGPILFFRDFSASFYDVT